MRAGALQGRQSESLHRLGAEVVVGDLFDLGQVEAAMRGVSGVYFCPLMHPLMAHSAMAFDVAARRAGVSAVVLLSPGAGGLMGRLGRAAF